MPTGRSRPGAPGAAMPRTCWACGPARRRRRASRARAASADRKPADSNRHRMKTPSRRGGWVVMLPCVVLFSRAAGEPGGEEGEDVVDGGLAGAVEVGRARAARAAGAGL